MGRRCGTLRDAEPKLLALQSLPLGLARRGREPVERDVLDLAPAHDRSGPREVAGLTPSISVGARPIPGTVVVVDGDRGCAGVTPPVSEADPVRVVRDGVLEDTRIAVAGGSGDDPRRENVEVAVTIQVDQDQPTLGGHRGVVEPVLSELQLDLSRLFREVLPDERTAARHLGVDVLRPHRRDDVTSAITIEVDRADVPQDDRPRHHARLQVAVLGELRVGHGGASEGAHVNAPDV